jgi:hypothetical protein
MTYTLPKGFVKDYFPDRFDKFIDKNGIQTTLDAWFADEHVEELVDYQSIDLRITRLLKPIGLVQERKQEPSYFTKQENNRFALGLNAQYLATIF